MTGPSAAAESAPDRGRRLRTIAAFVFGMLFMLPVYLLLATERFPLPARLLAWLGLGLSLLPGVIMVSDPRRRMNSIAATGMMIALFYHLAVFHERTLKLRWGEARISDLSLDTAQLLSALATPALWLGWYLVGALRLTRPLPRLKLEANDRDLEIVGAVIVLWSLLANLLWMRGELTTYQPLVSVISVLTPVELGFFMILLPQLKPGARGALRSRVLFFVLLAAMAFMGLMRGMIQDVAKPFVVYLLGWLYVRRRVRIGPVVAAVLVVLAMQPVKAEFRQRTWDRSLDIMGVVDRALLYVELLEQHWLGPGAMTEEDQGQSIAAAAARTGGALALANVVELTPSTVPHQLGKTYRYLLHAPMPRILDPDKPIAQYADVWAAVMYGYTSERGTAHVMVGLSQIAEVYINFGLLGGLLMLMLIGCTYRVADEIFGHPEAGQGATALYLFFVFVAMINWEGSFAQHLGGVVQAFTLYSLGMAVLSARARASQGAWGA